MTHVHLYLCMYMCVIRRGAVSLHIPDLCTAITEVKRRGEPGTWNHKTVTQLTRQPYQYNMNMYMYVTVH